MVKNLSDNEKDLKDPGLIPGWRRSLGEGNGNPLETLGQRILVGYSPWGPTELFKTEGN